MGFGWPTTFPQYVGTLLSWCLSHCVSFFHSYSWKQGVLYAVKNFYNGLRTSASIVQCIDTSQYMSDFSVYCTWQGFGERNLAQFCSTVWECEWSSWMGHACFLHARYVVDAADRDNILISKNELHDLLSKPSLDGIPLLVLGNKIDKPGAVSKNELTSLMYVQFLPF